MSAPVDIPIFNSLQLTMPAWFAVPTKNFGNPNQPVWWSLANPLTTARNLANRQHAISIDLVRRGTSKPKIEQNPWDLFHSSHHTGYKWGTNVERDFDPRTMIPEHFDELDQERIKKMKEHPTKTFANYPVIERGRPETLEANIIYNRHHKHHTLEQKYGNRYIDKYKETIIGRPIQDDTDTPDDRSASSSRTPTARSSASSISSKSKSSRPSRLSSLASSISLSKKSSKDSSSEEDSDSGSEGEYDSITSSQERSFARRQGDKNVFRPNASVSSKSSKSSRSSVSRGKPPLKRPEPNPKGKRIIVSRQPKPKPKTPSVSSASSASSKGSSESSSSSGSSRRSEPPAPPPPVVVVPETGKTKWAKPVGAQATAPRVQKARGRKPKYATDEEAYQAKLEQNKLGKQRKAEAKRKAKEDAEATTGTGVATHTMPDGTVMAGATHPSKPETQEERRFKFEEEQRKKYTEALSAKTEKLRVKEEKRLAKVLADSSKVKKPRKPRAKKPKKGDSDK